MKLIWYTALEARPWFAAWTRPEREGSRSIQRRALVDMEAAMWPKVESTAAEGSEAEGMPRLTQISSGLERRYPVRGWCSWREVFNVFFFLGTGANYNSRNRKKKPADKGQRTRDKEQN